MKYYKSYTESHEGIEGHFFCEVRNGIITRQINAFGENLYWATPEAENNEEYFYTDQPEFEPTDSDLEIAEAEFETLWEKANAQ